MCLYIQPEMYRSRTVYMNKLEGESNPCKTCLDCRKDKQEEGLRLRHEAREAEEAAKTEVRACHEYYAHSPLAISVWLSVHFLDFQISKNFHLSRQELDGRADLMLQPRL